MMGEAVGNKQYTYVSNTLCGKVIRTKRARSWRGELPSVAAAAISRELIVVSLPNLDSKCSNLNLVTSC